MGRAVSSEEFAAICLGLEKAGAENINIVTGSHAAPAIVLGIDAAREKGLTLPLLWNCSAYEGRETLSLLKDRVDVYLPDLKTLDKDLGARFFKAPDYPEYAEKAILAMLEARELSIQEGLIKSGLIVRHLVLPGFLGSTRKVLRWFADHAQGRALLSLMTQYTPPCQTVERKASAAPTRCLGREEYNQVLDWLGEFGIEEGFCQDLVTGDEWLPDFHQRNPFSSELSAPVWHWREGVL